jgi:hypothetical protein
MVLARAASDLRAIAGLGAATFLLSNGAALYAYRSGRPLFLLERRLDGRVESILVTSEPATSDESWSPIGEGELLVVWRRPRLGWAVILDGDSAGPRSFSASSRPPPLNEATQKSKR